MILLGPQYQHSKADRVELSLLVLTIEGLAQLVFGPSSCVNILYKPAGNVNTFLSFWTTSNYFSEPFLEFY